MNEQIYVFFCNFIHNNSLLSATKSTNYNKISTHINNGFAPAAILIVAVNYVSKADFPLLARDFDCYLVVTEDYLNNCRVISLIITVIESYPCACRFNSE